MEDKSTLKLLSPKRKEKKENHVMLKKAKVLAEEEEDTERDQKGRVRIRPKKVRKAKMHLLHEEDQEGDPELLQRDKKEWRIPSNVDIVKH